MTDYKAQIDEARRAQAAVYLATESDVADDLSRIIKGLADAVEALEQRALAAETRIKSIARASQFDQRKNLRRGWGTTDLVSIRNNVWSVLGASPSGLVEDMRRNTAADAWDEALQALSWAMENGPDPLRYVAEHNPYRTGTE